MQMKIFLELSVVLFLINTVEINALSLESTKMCRIFETPSMNQLNDECIGRLKFKCSYGYCSFDQKACENFQMIYTITRSLLRTHYFENRINTYKQFINTIKICPIRKQAITNLKYNVCSRDKTCMAQELIKWNNMSQLLTKKVYCPCIKEYRIDCDKEVCAHSRYDCIAYKLLKNKESHTYHQSCENGNREYSLKIQKS
jgi:hypothetical protein